MWVREINQTNWEATEVKLTYAKLKTAVYPSNFAFHELKLRQTPFQAIPVISFFDAWTFVSGFVWPGNLFGVDFCQDFEEL